MDHWIVVGLRHKKALGRGPSPIPLDLDPQWETEEDKEFKG